MPTEAASSEARAERTPPCAVEDDGLLLGEVIDGRHADDVVDGDAGCAINVARIPFFLFTNIDEGDVTAFDKFFCPVNVNPLKGLCHRCHCCVSPVWLGR